MRRTGTDGCRRSLPRCRSRTTSAPRGCVRAREADRIHRRNRDRGERKRGRNLPAAARGRGAEARPEGRRARALRRTEKGEKNKKNEREKGEGSKETNGKPRWNGVPPYNRTGTGRDSSWIESTSGSVKFKKKEKSGTVLLRNCSHEGTAKPEFFSKKLFLRRTSKESLERILHR